jgi:hypothetical protein
MKKEVTGLRFRLPRKAAWGRDLQTLLPVVRHQAPTSSASLTMSRHTARSRKASAKKPLVFRAMRCGLVISLDVSPPPGSWVSYHITESFVCVVCGEPEVPTRLDPESGPRISGKPLGRTTVVKLYQEVER